jgi:TATA-box binding protein (TBP) (component of TFIID and TFIIIB)
MDMYEYIQEISSIRERVVRSRPDWPAPSWIKITTMTMHSKNDMKVDIPKFRERFQAMTIRPKGSDGPGFQWTIRNTGFYNQVSIRCHDDYSEKSVKIFPNGTIHLAGGNSPIDGERILNQVAFIMKDVLELEELPTLAPFEISMINSNFHFNVIVNSHKVKTRFEKLEGFKVTYEPDRYSAVKIKFKPKPHMKKMTVSVFKSGATLVGGAKTLEEIAAAYDVMLSYTDASLFVAKAPVVQKLDTILGATFDEWDRVLQNKM